MSSVDMNKWLANAYNLCTLPQPAGLTAKSYRRAGVTAAYHAGADRLLFCRCADWEPGGSTFEDSYFDQPCGSTWLLPPTFLGTCASRRACPKLNLDAVIWVVFMV
jgi:hypothetical protein